MSARAVLAAILGISAIFLRESPSDLDLPEPDPHPENLFAENHSTTPTSLRGLLVPLLQSRSFLLVCGLSLGLTLLRETFNTWTPTYFVQAAMLSEGDAARASALFPAFGGVSVLLAGWLGDRFGAVGTGADHHRWPVALGRGHVRPGAHGGFLRTGGQCPPWSH